MQERCVFSWDLIHLYSEMILIKWEDIIHPYKAVEKPPFTRKKRVFATVANTPTRLTKLGRLCNYSSTRIW